MDHPQPAPAEPIEAVPQDVPGDVSQTSAGTSPGTAVVSAGTAPGLLLAELEAAAAAYVADQRPANTLRAYAGDWQVWQRYTAALGIPDHTGTAGALVGFVAWLEQHGAAPATADRRLTGAVVSLRERGVDVDRQAARAARQALTGYRRRLAEAGRQLGRGPAPAVTVAQLRRMVGAGRPTTSPAGVRDRALLLIAFTTAARRSEVAGLLVRDLVDDDQGLVVTIRYGKSGGRTVPVPRGSHPSTDPVAAWHAWRDLAQLVDDPDGPAFRAINRHGRIGAGLSPAAVGDIIAAAADRAGLAARYTGHSLRAGLATEARRAGHDAKTIAQQTGHSPTSPVLYRYMRTVDQWTDNAVTGLGL